MDRQATTVADALVAADLDLAPDVRGDLAPKVTFDAVVGLDVLAELDEVVLGEILDANVAPDGGGLQRGERARSADAEDVGERDLQPLLAGEVDADEACHTVVLLAVFSGGRTRPTPISWAPASDRGSVAGWCWRRSGNAWREGQRPTRW